jgi:polyisoprenoid-binding protein YceI
MARYEIDESKTMVWIDARSSLHPIHTESKALRGYFEGELGTDSSLSLEAGPSAALELPIEALSSGNAMYDREMRRRVDARRYPTIDAVLRTMTPTGSTGRYRTEGDVTFRGVTQRVSDEVTLSVPEPGSLVFEGEHVFNLPDFGMEPPKILMLKVYPDVKVRVRIVAKAKS